MPCLNILLAFGIGNNCGNRPQLYCEWARLPAGCFVCLYKQHGSGTGIRVRVRVQRSVPVPVPTGMGTGRVGKFLSGYG